MMKMKQLSVGRLFGLMVAWAAVLCAGGCDDSTATSKSIQCSKECANVGGLEKVCVSIDDEEKCELACTGGKEGVNAAICTQDGTSLPPGSPYYSTVYTCAKDDLGTLYVKDQKRDLCDNGCDDKTGKCINNSGDDCNLNCDNVGGLPEVCVKVGGEEKCELACSGNNEGANAPVCTQNGTSLPPGSPYYSTVYTCAKDELGTLYVTDKKQELCEKGCNEQSGLCITNTENECTLDCIMDGGLPQVCVKLGGTEKCELACSGDKEGVNAPVCTQNGSALPPGSPYYSTIYTCAKDELGTLYVTDKKRDLCDNGCDEKSGLCINSENECTLDCITEGGLPQVCVKLGGKEKCELECIGNQEGVNAPVCTQNGSALPPGSPYYSTVYTCSKDEIGTLYVTDQKRDLCSKGCDSESGLCYE